MPDDAHHYGPETPCSQCGEPIDDGAPDWTEYCDRHADQRDGGGGDHYVELFQSRHFEETVEIWCPERDEEKAILGRYYIEYCPMCGANIAGWCDNLLDAQ